MPMPVVFFAETVFIYVVLLCGGPYKISASTYDHSEAGFLCHDRSLADESIGPNFGTVAPSTNRIESVATLQDREYSILSYYARTALPLNDSSDDYTNQLFMKIGPPTHPMLNSRDDVRRVVNRYMSRILLGCYNNTDMDDIFLSDVARPFAEPGTSSLSGTCFRDGDYDFSTIDLLQLLYVSRQYPGSMPETVFAAIRDKLLSINGTITTNGVFTQCRVKVGPIKADVTIQLDEDTENHILQAEISRYLSNQLLIEVYPKNMEFDNNLNGNTVWMLEHLSIFLRSYFYEYNSRPYQSFTVKAITVLHSFAHDKEIQLVSEMILDMVSSFTGMQMNQLRRFVPFRRQPKYVNLTHSYEGESELFRMAILVGNFGTIVDKNNSLPSLREYASLLADFNVASTIASKYRLKDFILDMFFRNNKTPGVGTSSLSSQEYFISNHDTVEMYYTTPNFLISAGGNSASPIVPKPSFRSRFCFFNSCLLDGYLFREVAREVITQFTTGERGWARPTTIIPSVESSTDLLDMIHFLGGRNVTIGKYSTNLCVAPNFACGLQLRYGNILGPNLDQCSITNGNWKFLDLSGMNNNTRSKLCPTYGYYMAIYVRPCVQCIDTADNYGLLEISEDVKNMSLTMFQQKVLANNPYPFNSRGVQTYVPLSGRGIAFEINPISDTLSQIIQIQGVDGNLVSRDYNTDYRTWPLAWSSSGSIQSSSMIGRWTYDTRDSNTDEQHKLQRYIYDVTNPLQPQRIVSKLPNLMKHSVSNVNIGSRGSGNQTFMVGRYFDDSSNVIYNDSIQSMSFTYSVISGSITGFRMIWRSSGLSAFHGYVKDQSNLWYRVQNISLNMNEQITTVGVRSSILRGVNRLHIITNQNRTFFVGSNGIIGRKSTDENASEEIYTMNHMIAFYGHVDDALIRQLRVVSIE